MFTFVASTIKLAVDMWSSPQGHSALVRLTDGSDVTHSSTWRLGSTSGPAATDTRLEKWEVRSCVGYSTYVERKINLRSFLCVTKNLENLILTDVYMF